MAGSAVARDDLRHYQLNNQQRRAARRNFKSRDRGIHDLDMLVQLMLDGKFMCVSHSLFCGAPVNCVDSNGILMADAVKMWTALEGRGVTPEDNATRALNGRKARILWRQYTSLQMEDGRRVMYRRESKYM